MKQTILGALMGALVMGAIAACGVAISDPGNNQNANTDGGNAVCNCPKSPVEVKVIELDGSNAIDGKTVGAAGLVCELEGVPAGSVLSSWTFNNGKLDPMQVIESGGKTYANCSTSATRSLRLVISTAGQPNP